jgi:hypothetical protein
VSATALGQVTSPVLEHPFAPLFHARRATSKRASSWDRTGANSDWITVEPHETATLLEETGAGCITRLYCAMALPDLRDYRNAIIRCYWDGNPEPAVEVPMGDFFGVAHGRIREFSSALTAVNAGCGASHGLNCYLPMPFSEGARITVENRGDTTLGGLLRALWYHIEYETYAEPLPSDVDRFHACWRQEMPTTPVGEPKNVTLHDGINLDGRDNYVALDTQGAGRMVGLLLEIENVQGDVWYGEGDDMVFIDGDTWPPSIHGTGTEEIFGGGACPSTEYAAHYSGFHQIESPRYGGLVAMYRWYVNDPIHFQSSIRWTLEHGHANNFENIYRSVAYWYQQPQAKLPPLPAADAMLPPLGDDYDTARQQLFEAVGQARETITDSREALSTMMALCRAGEPLYLGRPQETLAALRQVTASGG